MKKLVLIAAVIIFALVIYSKKFNRTYLLNTAIDLPDTGNIQEKSALNHLACIMDGNRRWAKKKDWCHGMGMKKGWRQYAKWCNFASIKKLNIFLSILFSLENFARSEEENSYLFSLMVQEAEKGVEEFRKHGIRLRFIGDRSLYSVTIIPLLDRVEKETADLIRNVTFLFCTAAAKK